MNIAIFTGIISAVAAVIGIYFQYLKISKIKCARPSNCIISPIMKEGMGIMVPLSLTNSGSNPIAVERFSLHLGARGKDGDLSGSFQVGLQWYICSTLSFETELQFGIPFTLSGKNTHQMVVGFTNPKKWNFSEGHSQIKIYVHTPRKPAGIELCKFDIFLKEKEILKLQNQEKVSFFQRWYGKKDSYNVLIPHDSAYEGQVDDAENSSSQIEK